VANTPYYVLAGGYGGASGNLHITATAAPTPFNDTCTNAIPMTNSVVYSVNTDNATETSDPGLCCGYSLGRGVWYTFSPPITERVTITTCGSDFILAGVFTGICGTFGSNPPYFNDNDGPDCDGLSASVNFSATAGTTYYILVAVRWREREPANHRHCHAASLQ